MENHSKGWIRLGQKLKAGLDAEIQTLYRDRGDGKGENYMSKD